MWSTRFERIVKHHEFLTLITVTAKGGYKIMVVGWRPVHRHDYDMYKL